MDPDDGAIERLLETLDVPAPPVTMGDIAARAHGSPAWHRRMGAAAAAVLLAGAVWALPGSPLRDHPTPETAPADAPAQSPFGIQVEPGLRFALRLASASVARVTLTDATEITVRSNAGTATFTSDAGLLTIVSAPADTLEIRVPRAAPSVVIEVAGTVLWRKVGDDITPARTGGIWIVGPMRADPSRFRR